MFEVRQNPGSGGGSIIRPALRAAGLDERIRTYDLRHGHASMLIDLGANVLAVAQRMGHSDPSVTLREYGHLFAGVQERLSEQLDELRQATWIARPAELVDLSERTPPEPRRKTRTGHATTQNRGLRRQVADSSG